MLSAAGLLASRVGAVVSESDALRRLDYLRELRTANPGRPIFAYDMVQRLATEFSGEYQKYNEIIREWAILKDRVENLHQEEYRARYEELAAQLPPEVTDDYLLARRRNHEVNKAVIRLTAEGILDYLVLSQDDAAPFGLHRPEQEALARLIDELGAHDKINIFSGADEIDTVLIARLVNLWSDTTPAITVDYSGIDGTQWTPPYEVEHYADNIRLHIEAAGGTVVHEDADLHLMVNSPSATEECRGADLDAFVGRCADLLASGETVAVLDPVFVNRADPELIQRMETHLEISELIAYSGWNTAGNALGLCLSHAVTRWSWLQHSVDGTDNDGAHEREAERIHAEYLLHRFVLDDRWKNRVQPAAYEQARNMGANPYGLLPDQERVMAEFVRTHLAEQTRQFYQRHFAGARIEGRAETVQITGLRDIDIALPWPRLFETGLEPDLVVRSHQ